MNYYLLDKLNNNKKGGYLKELIDIAEEYTNPKYINSCTNIHLQIIKNSSFKKLKYELKIVNGKTIIRYIDYNP